MPQSPGAQPQHLCFQARLLDDPKAPCPACAMIGIALVAPDCFTVLQVRLRKGLLTGTRSRHSLFILLYGFRKQLT